MTLELLKKIKERGKLYRRYKLVGNQYAAAEFNRAKIALNN